MIKHLTILLLLSCSFAEQVPLVWQASPSTNVTGYIVYYTQFTGWTNGIAVGKTTNTVVTVADGLNTFYVVAVNNDWRGQTNYQSVPSNFYTNFPATVVTIPSAPLPPSNLRGTTTVIININK